MTRNNILISATLILIVLLSVIDSLYSKTDDCFFFDVLTVSGFLLIAVIVVMESIEKIAKIGKSPDLDIEKEMKRLKSEIHDLKRKVE